LAAHPASLYNPKLYQLNEYTQQSLFAGDTIGWGKWSLLAGFRYTTYKDTVRGVTNAVSTIYKANPLSPTVALSYEIMPRTRAYVSYVQGLQNGGAAGSTNLNYGATFGPIHTQQYEAGLKTDQGIWNITLALFRLDQGADYVNTSNIYVQSGQVRYQGVEGNAAVRPTPDWTLSASASYLDAALRDEGPVYTGKEAPGVSKVQATVRVAYQIPIAPGLGVDLNVKYTGDGYGNTLNTLKFPAYETEDLGVSYTTTLDTHHVTFRGAVKNLTDKDYWIYSSSTVLPGEPRTFMFSVHGDF
jgi:iron complex outermembrane receptor protein